MTKAVSYQIYSQDPNHYNTVSFNPTIPWNTHKVEYRVKNVNTYSNFLITTDDDYITFENGSEYYSDKETYHFSDRTEYDVDELPQLLTQLFHGIGVNVIKNDSGVLEFSSEGNIKITECTHRVQLLLGLYNMKFPIESDNMVIKAGSTPLVNYGNVLYLKSHQGNSVGMMINDKNYHAPIIYRINQFLKSGVPLISNEKGDKIIVNAEAAKSITMELVDFMFEPIILKSPMFITVKIKLISEDRTFLN